MNGNSVGGKNIKNKKKTRKHSKRVSDAQSKRKSVTTEHNR